LIQPRDTDEHFYWQFNNDRYRWPHGQEAVHNITKYWLNENHALICSFENPMQW
jgi:hypothetical protein